MQKNTSIRPLEEYVAEFSKLRFNSLVSTFVSFIIGVGMAFMPENNFLPPILILACMCTIMCYLIALKYVIQVAIFYKEDITGLIKSDTNESSP